jgi:hypothetical protein
MAELSAIAVSLSSIYFRYFAAQAMQYFVVVHDGAYVHVDYAATQCYKFADAMLAERNKT